MHGTRLPWYMPRVSSFVWLYLFPGVRFLSFAFDLLSWVLLRSLFRHALFHICTVRDIYLVDQFCVLPPTVSAPGSIILCLHVFFFLVLFPNLSPQDSNGVAQHTTTLDDKKHPGAKRATGDKQGMGYRYHCQHYFGEFCVSYRLFWDTWNTGM